MRSTALIQEKLQIKKEAVDVSKIIEQRDRDMVVIESEVHEINAIFKDMAQLAAIQSEQVDMVGVALDETVQNVQEGLKEIKVKEASLSMKLCTIL